MRRAVVFGGVAGLMAGYFHLAAAQEVAEAECEPTTVVIVAVGLLHAIGIGVIIGLLCVEDVGQRGGALQAPLQEGGLEPEVEKLRVAALGDEVLLR